MKLYYAPGACSLSPHIVLCEAGLAFTTERVSLKTKLTTAGVDYRTINTKGSVPALVLDDGRVLTEGPAVIQYLADLKPDSGLAPRWGTFERYQLMEILNYITSELHKGFAPLFNPASSAEVKTAAAAALSPKFVWTSGRLGTNPYLMGNIFTVADAYLFVVLNWVGMVGIELAKWPTLAAYHARVAARPKVQEAMKAEGLLK